MLRFFVHDFKIFTYNKTMKSNCIILTGGGTAGHVTLNINLESELKKHFSKIVYIGSKTGIEKSLITSKTSYNFYEIPTVKSNRKNMLKNVLIPFKLKQAKNEAIKILKEQKPEIVFSKGGYVGLPVVLAAHKLGIPIVCHESDISMGLANKLAKKYASKICTNFQITAMKNGQKCVHTSMPLKLSNLTKDEAKTKFKIKTQKPVLLVTGGSLGSKALNDFVFKNIKTLQEEYFVVHLTGKGKLNKKIHYDSYLQIEFCDDMWTLYRATDFAISRAGANTIIELLSNKILTIFVPLPKTVSRGDQIENAKMLTKNSLAETIFQEDLSLEKVQKSLIFLKNNSKIIKNEIKNANFEDGTQKIINIILQEKNT